MNLERLKPMTDLPLAGRRVLIREDLNVPLANGAITSDRRLRAALPTVQTALAAGARVLLMSHLGRPEGRGFEADFSLTPVAAWLADALGRPVPLLADWQNSPPELDDGEVVLLENLRFLPGETDNDPALARRLAGLCDLFVMDAFATAHRAHCSTVGVAHYAPEVCAGPLLVAELHALERALANPARPLLAVVGGAKVSSKLGLLRHLAGMADHLLPGGGIANTFIAAAGHGIGRSLCEPGRLDDARAIMAETEVLLPQRVVVAKSPEAGEARTLALDAVGAEDRILDLELPPAAAKIVADAGTVLWNGPLGVFERPQFAAGTRALALAIADSGAFSIVGGGDTLAAVEQFGVAKHLSYCSTGGGAFLEFVEGRELPGVAALVARDR